MIELTDKHRQLKQFKDDLFNKTLTMFDWQNLPDTLPQVELEKLLQINGFAVIAEYKVKTLTRDQRKLLSITRLYTLTRLSPLIKIV